MQDKTISLVILTDDKGKKGFRPYKLDKTISLPFNHHFIAEIIAASNKDAFKAVCISLAQFNSNTQGAGSKDEVESWAGIYVDLDWKEEFGKIDTQGLADDLKEMFPNTAGLTYQSCNGKGAHFYLFYDSNRTDKAKHLDALTYVLEKVYANPKYKKCLDMNATSLDRKIYIPKDAEVIYIDGEGFDDSEMRYASEDERKAVESSIKKGEPKAIMPSDDEDDNIPDDDVVCELFDKMTEIALIGGYRKKDKWWSIDAPQWKNSETPINQWRMNIDCRGVTPYGKGDSYKDLGDFVRCMKNEYKNKCAFATKLPIGKGDSDKMKVLVRHIANIIKPVKDTKKKERKEKKDLRLDVKDFIHSNMPRVREIITRCFRNTLDDYYAKLYRIETSGKYKDEYHCIRDNGYNNIIYGGGNGGKMKFINIFGAEAWDTMVDDIKIGVFTLIQYNGDIDKAKQAIIDGTENLSAEDKEAVREALLKNSENYDSPTEAIMDGINTYIVDSCGRERIWSPFDIKRNDTLYWSVEKERLECWIGEYKLFDNKFNSIMPSESTKIYTNDYNLTKKHLGEVNELMDVEEVEDILSDMDKYVVNNPRLISGGKWQGVFLAGIPMTSIMSSYLGLLKARPVIGIKGTMGLGKSYISEFILSVMGKDFGTKRDGQITEAALRRELSASGLLVVDDNMANDERKAKAFQGIAKTNFNGDNVVKCSMGPESSGKLTEFQLNSLLMFCGTVIPTDVDDGNNEADSRMTVINVEKDNDEDSDLAHEMKIGIPEATRKNENNHERNLSFMLYLISKVDDYIVNYERFRLLFNRYASTHGVNNGNRRSDIAAAMLSGYSTQFDRKMTDAEATEVFLEYSANADDNSKNETFVKNFLTKSIRMGTISNRVADDDMTNTSGIDTENVSKGMSLFTFGTKKTVTNNEAEFFASIGVFRGSNSSVDRAPIDTIYIKKCGDVFDAKTITGSDLAPGDKKIAVSNLLQMNEFKDEKARKIYTYLSKHARFGTNAGKNIGLHLQLSVEDLKKICGDADNTDPPPKKEEAPPPPITDKEMADEASDSDAAKDSVKEFTDINKFKKWEMEPPKKNSIVKGGDYLTAVKKHGFDKVLEEL